MAFYSVSSIEVKDWEIYDEYMKHVPAIIEKYGGRYLVRGGEIRAQTEGWDINRIVILEFPTLEAMENFRTSPEYAPVAELRHKAATTKSFVVEGYDG